MKITNITDKKIIMSANAENTENSRSISIDFASSMDLASKEQSRRQLKQMLSDIENLGKRLASTRSLEDTKKYKKKVQEYLEYAVKNGYALRKEAGPLNYGVHVSIEVINKKLDELTKNILDKERSNLEIADKIDEIKGLLVDVYK